MSQSQVQAVKLGDEIMEVSSLVQLSEMLMAPEQVTNVGTKAKINADMSDESSSDSSDSDEPSDDEHLAIDDEDTELANVSPSIASTQADCTNCHESEPMDQPKPQTFTPDEGKVETMFENYSGADNDDFIH